ncbi:MAG TPA: MBL fold metallo-hydrolase, partial [Solirubrobacterales bacterium]|nr:MBL fold metallo-hydrolase [Solirubrobacterales bacterium]
DRLGRAVAITGDTRPSRNTVEAAHDADLLIHDASFMVEDRDRADETGHSTGTEAAEVAAEAGAKMLALVHISSRYHVGKALEEAKAVFENTVAPRDFDTVEIPFPERGEPELVPKGAKRNAPPSDPE